MSLVEEFLKKVEAAEKFQKDLEDTKKRYNKLREELENEKAKNLNLEEIVEKLAEEEKRAREIFLEKISEYEALPTSNNSSKLVELFLQTPKKKDSYKPLDLRSEIEKIYKRGIRDPDAIFIEISSSYSSLVSNLPIESLYYIKKEIAKVVEEKKNGGKNGR
ncbi:MAG: hypothetical protein QXK48_02280 [Candidatus Aenigmatarchaeota archaeon]